MFPHCITPSIELKLLQSHHAAELFQITDTNRDHLRQWLPWLDLTNEEKDTAAFISSTLQAFADSGTLSCGIWHQEKLCGVIGYNSINWNSKIGYFGYWLAKEAEGKGIITQCCQALIEHAFTEYNLNRVVINVATENRKSQAIPDRLGFTREGIIRDAEWLYDHYVDHTINGLLKKDASKY